MKILESLSLFLVNTFNNGIIVNKHKEWLNFLVIFFNVNNAMSKFNKKKKFLKNLHKVVELLWNNISLESETQKSETRAAPLGGDYEFREMELGTAT